MDAPAVSLVRKMAAALLAFALALSMAPVAWADDGPASTLAGAVAGNAAEAEAPGDGADADSGAAVAPDDEQAPEAEVQSAEAKAADGTGSATGTTIKIAVYRSSYPLVWDLNDEGSADVTRAQWAGSDGHSAPASWPMEGSPGSAVGAYDGYTEADEPTRTGFAFLGWSAVADDPTVAGKLDTLEIPKGTEPVEGADGVKSITLYALWAPIEYSVVFDLTKNPEDASAVPSFSWTTGKGTFTDLGGGRYRLSGVTLEDYDPERGLIEIATPSRGTGGYRFLSWAEPESQQSPTVAMKPAGTAKWYVNPVALTRYDYEPVLTARWSLSFDVDVPSQITFDQYDSLEIEGNLTDTTDEDVVDEESDDRHDAGKMAHFCSQSTAVDYKIVALKSEMQATASDILTTSDSAKATQEQVLNDEKLLSLFAANNASEGAGVHFRLTDAIDMDDSSRYGAFVIPKQTKEYADADYSRDDEERLYVSYRLNLSNRVDGASEPNHGLVTPANVNEGDRTPIAKVSYEFAVADHEVEAVDPLAPTGSASDALYIACDNGIYGLADIKKAALDLSAHVSEDTDPNDYVAIESQAKGSSYYALYKGFMVNESPFMLKVGDSYQEVQILGICQDTIASGENAGSKAGLTFGFKDIYAYVDEINEAGGGGYFNCTLAPGNVSTGGWLSCQMRKTLRGTSFWSLLGEDIQDEAMGIVSVRKTSQLTTPQTYQTSSETVFLPSAWEVFGQSDSRYNPNENDTNSFHYMHFAGWGMTGETRNLAQKTFNGTPVDWFFRSASKTRANTDMWCISSGTGELTWGYGAHKLGIVPAFCL